MVKKIVIFIFMLLVMPLSVRAENIIYSIDMDINILEDGTANITEVWDVDGMNGTEWYKVMNNLGNSELSNFKVSMDGNNLNYKDWNVNESLSQKRGYYGINYTNDGLELCFGKYDYNRHRFTLNYTLSNYVYNTSDSQVLSWNLIDELSDVDFRNFSVTVSSYYEFPDTLDVWGYGYKGYAYVEDGKIKMSNEDDMDDKYVVLLAKFPLNTFNTNNVHDEFDDFDDAYNAAEEGTFEYDYGNNSGVVISFIGFILNLIFTLFPILIVLFGVKGIVNRGYGYKNNKVIDKKNVPMFRDIPCNKDIYYGNALIYLNNFDYKESNILGAIILKWVKENKIIFKNETVGIFNKETSVIDLTMNPSFDNELEKKLFDIMYEASKDGLLETKELEKWSRKNYSEFFDMLSSFKDKEIERLTSSGYLRKRIDKNECKKKNVMEDIIYDDSIKLYGLKKFLIEFSNMKDKEVIDVHLWDEYLMFAYLFGIADKVAKQLKNMYPEIMEQMDYDYDTLIFVNNISVRSVSAASSARSAAESYSSGGGGFSSGGGGGGSFGGGGGGSR